MSIEKRVEEIKEDLDFFEDELQKYEYFIDLGKKLPKFDEKNIKLFVCIKFYFRKQSKRCSRI